MEKNLSLPKFVRTDHPSLVQIEPKFFSSFKFHISCDVPRCVPGSQGSFALGVQQIITRILAFIPAPIVYGALLDSVCLLSESDPCNEDVDRNCLEYRNDGLRYGLKF